MVRKASVNLCSPTMASASNSRTITPTPTAMFVSHQGFRFRRPSNENSSWVIDIAQTLLFVSHRSDFAEFCRLTPAFRAWLDGDALARRSVQSRNNSLIEVFARVFSSTRLTITAQ